MRKQSNDFVTKNHFDKTITDVNQKFDKKLIALRDGLILYFEGRFNKIEEALDKHEKILESISKTLDWLVHKFTKLDEELHENLSNHETRIQVLEKKSSYVK